jgi:large subunit ribosomal protein L3
VTKGKIIMQGLWFKKVGMTQLFQEDGALIPVTVVSTGRWIVTQIKTVEGDGYVAWQIGNVRDRYARDEYNPEWLKHKDDYFERVCEIQPADLDLAVGADINVEGLFEDAGEVTVVGLTIGRGFQGGVKRHGFAGGPGSHGGKLGRKPGSMGFMRSRGRVIKGWRMAGHHGTEQRTIRNLSVARKEKNDDGYHLMLKGSVPGKSSSFIYVRKV